ncbi:MAG: hypothetical protein ACAH59_11310 [Pseudobdellovibrionaceae bacterium]
MKKRNRFRNYLSLEALVILLVIGSFKVIPDKRTASLFASFLFISSSLAILYWETRTENFKKRASFWGALGFLVFSALPILALRLIYWEMPFEEIQMGPITGADMHKYANYVFFLMMVCFFVDAQMERVKEKENLLNQQQ